MTLTVKEKAEYLGVFRWMEVFLMETLASWVPTTPEMEIKVLSGGTSGSWHKMPMALVNGRSKCGRHCITR